MAGLSEWLRRGCSLLSHPWGSAAKALLCALRLQQGLWEGEPSQGCCGIERLCQLLGERVRGKLPLPDGEKRIPFQNGP